MSKACKHQADTLQYRSDDAKLVCFYIGTPRACTHMGREAGCPDNPDKPKDEGQGIKARCPYCGYGWYPQAHQGTFWPMQCPTCGKPIYQRGGK